MALSAGPVQFWLDGGAKPSNQEEELRLPTRRKGQLQWAKVGLSLWWAAPKGSNKCTFGAVMCNKNLFILLSRKD